MSVVGVSIVPIGTKAPGISSFVAGCLKVLNRYDDLIYELTPMATVIEGDLTRILEAVKEMHEAPFGSGAVRVLTNITIDDRRDRELTMRGKVGSVEEKI